MGFHFNKFREYARFLQGNQKVLDGLKMRYFEKIRNSSIPLMRFLNQMSREQHKKITDQNIENFLQHSLSNTAFEDAILVVDQWRSNELLGLAREEIEVTDIIAVTDMRKQVYIDFLDQYTQELPLFRSIVSELDGFHMQFQKYAFDSYVEIHQEKLANENQFISSLINNSVDGILAFDKQLKITEFNQVLERWYGIKREDVIGEDILKVFSAYKGSQEGNPLQKALRGEKTFIPESPFPDRRGFYEANIVPLYDYRGAITGGTIITHDITNRKEAEDEIKETKHLLQEIADAVPSVIFVNDYVTKEVVFVNKELKALAGYTAEEVKSFSREKIEGLVYPDDLPALKKQMKEINGLNNGEVSVLNVRIRHKDGRWKWIRTKSKIFKYGENGAPQQTIRVLEDVTEIVEAQQKIQQQNEELAASNEELAAALEEWQAAEEQLREINEELEYRVEVRTKELAESEKEVKRSEEHLRLITDAMPVLISYLRTDLTYGFVNKAYEDLHKRKKEEIIGKPMWEVIGEKAYKNKQPLLKRALKGEYVSSEMLQDYYESERKWVKISVVPHLVDGKVVGAFSLVEDITEFKEIQLKQESLLKKLDKANKEKIKALNQLEKKNKDLERTNTDLDNFIYTASHDLKAPITNMEGLMGILNNSLPEKMDAKEEKLLEMMGASVRRLQKTISDLVEITKVQRELEEAVEEVLRLEELSSEVKEDIFSLIQSNQAVIKEDYQVKEVKYRKSSLRSILYNLLSNAIKYRNPEKPLEVTLKTYLQDDCVVLSIKDNGLGLSQAQQKKLFTLFKRMHQHVEGTGVGLFMIKRIVENNGGRIKVKSKEGEGTEFLVFLVPIAKVVE